MNIAFLADTSVAVPALLASHQAHAVVRLGLDGRDVALASHSALETYAVLTRLPGDARLAPADAALLIRRRFGDAVLPEPDRVRTLLDAFADAGIAGGATYDALIAITAAGARRRLLTRDTRAAATYAALAVPFDIVR